MSSNINNSKPKQANKPNQRRDLHTWLYYNEHFNIEQLNPLPTNSETPPPSYRHFRQDLLYQNEFIKPSQIKRRTVVPKEKEQTFFDKVIEGLHNYCETSTLHGLKYIGEKKLGKAQRIFWLMAFLTALVFATYFITTLFLTYIASPVMVRYSPKTASVHSVPFPAVTVCNMNIAVRSRAQRILDFGTSAEKEVLSDLCGLDDKEYHHSENITWETMEFVIRNITQLCEEMVIGCEWRGQAYHCPSIINSALSDDGYCCSFNRLPLNFTTRRNVSEPHLSYPDEIINWTPEAGYPSNVKTNTYPFRAFGRGVEQGLTLVLNAALDDYYCSTTHSFGFKARFHSPREHPKMGDLGFIISPGLETRLTVEADLEHASDNIRGIDSHIRQCLFSNEKYLKYFEQYSARHCIMECEANYTEKLCGCIPFYLPADDNTKICDKSDERCTRLANFIIGSYGGEKAKCGCLPGCTQINYYPGIRSAGRLLNLNNITYHKYLGNLSQAYFAQNVAIVHLYFNEYIFLIKIKRAVYSFTEFLSNVGGLLGLFLGFGFLSIVEIFYHLFIRSSCVWYQNKCSKKKNKRQKVFLQ